MIPALVQINEEVETLKNQEEDENSRKFLGNILTSMNKRFKENWTKKAPFNCLTFLDPRNVGIYATEPDVFDKIIRDIKYDTVFEADAESDPLPTLQAGSSLFAHEAQVTDVRSRLFKRRKEAAGIAAGETFESKLEAEINR